MQFRAPSAGTGSYAPRNSWPEALDDPGAGQMRHLKALMLSRPYFDRVYDATAVVSESGDRHERLIATKGRDYLFVYSYTGRPFSVRPGAIAGASLRAWWFNPRDGRAQLVGIVGSGEAGPFAPPGEPDEGRDWVLVLDDASRGYQAPGTVEWGAKVGASVVRYPPQK